MTMRITFEEFIGLDTCPICGSDDAHTGKRPHFREGKGYGWTVRCADCGCSLGFIERPDGSFYAEFDTKSDAIAAWNNRVNPTCDFELTTDMGAIRCSECGYKLPKGIDLGMMRFCSGCGCEVTRRARSS